MDVSVIIVNYNTLKLTNQCIESVRQYTKGINFEIILIDNASSDGSKEYFEHNKDIVYIYCHKNLGFGQANNFASKKARGKYLFFLNSDTILCNNAINILFNYIERYSKVGAVGGNLFKNENTPTISYERRFPGIISDLNSLTFGKVNRVVFGNDITFNHTDFPIKVAYISGADLMISKSLFDELDGFSRDFFMYYEETDLCYRIHKLGLSVMSIPSAKIIHLEGGSQQKNLKAIIKKNIIQIESRQIFIRRHHSKIYYWFDKKLLILALRIRILLKRNVNTNLAKINTLNYLKWIRF